MRALTLGRFQPFHNGHLMMLEYVADNEDDLLVGIGSSNVLISFDNPFTFDERRLMLEKAFDTSKKTEVVPIPDFNNNKLWVENIIDSFDFDYVYTNSENEKEIFEGVGVKVFPIPFYDRIDLSGHHVREKILEGDSWKLDVPFEVAEIIDEIQGVERIRGLKII